MRTKPVPAAMWVQLTQALLARELVEGFGLSARQAAERLGLAPSAVSQYLSGKRLQGSLAGIDSQEDVRRLIRRYAEEWASRTRPVPPTMVGLLEASVALAALAGPTAGSALGSANPHSAARRDSRTLGRMLRRRIAGEQAAVADCMRLAQKSRDELTRAIFRQIASDSLRHAEIVASLETYLDRGVSRTVASGITQEDVERLIAREHAAEATSGPNLGRELGGIMGLLWESMAADERKHDALLERLRRPEMLGVAPAPLPTALKGVNARPRTAGTGHVRSAQIGGQ